MKEIYFTAAGSGQAEITEKRSRFIASVKPVASEKEALDFLSSLKQKYWDARHNVFAYIIRENNIMRYSDDGEPGGTAGLPVLDILKNEGLTDIIVVVTRYFGGILLGTGGLVHAYSKSAKSGIENAGVSKMVLCRKIIIEVEYPLLGKLKNELAKQPEIKFEEPLYTDSVSLPIFVPESQTDSLAAFITDKMNGRTKIIFDRTEYIQMK